MKFIPKLNHKVIFATALFLQTAFAVAAAAPTPVPRSTQEVSDHHRVAWDTRSLDDIVADYAEDATVVVVNKVYAGRPAIREMFAELFRIFDVTGPQTMDSSFLIGKIIYFTWHTTYLGQTIPFGTDTFVVENGQITYQTISSTADIFGTLMN